MSLLLLAKNGLGHAGALPEPPPPDWDLLRDFNSGTLGATAMGADAFSSEPGLSVYSNDRSVSGTQSGKLTHPEGTAFAFNFGGIISFPSPAYRGDSIWIECYMFFPEDFVIDTDAGTLKFLRIATARADPGAPSEGFLDTYIRDDGNSWPFSTIKEAQFLWQYSAETGSFPKGRWVRVTQHAHLDNVAVDAGGQGRVRIWMDGVLVANHTAITTLVHADTRTWALYLFTFWNGPCPKLQSCYVDDIRIAKNGVPSWAYDLEGIA